MENLVQKISITAPVAFTTAPLSGASGNPYFVPMPPSQTGYGTPGNSHSGIMKDGANISLYSDGLRGELYIKTLDPILVDLLTLYKKLFIPTLSQ